MSRRLSKEQCEAIAIVATLPFLIVLWVTEGKPRWEQFRLNPALEERHCDIIHEHQKPGKKCDRYDEDPPYFHG